MQVVCESFSARRRIILVSIAVSCTNALQGEPDKTLLAVYPVDFWNAHGSLITVPLKICCMAPAKEGGG